MTSTHAGSYLLTGATSGIGAAVAQALANRGACLHLVGRNREALNAARKQLLTRGAGAVDIHTLDLSELSALKDLAKLPGQLPPLAGLVLAAGVIEPVRRVDERGVEHNYVVNHLSKVALLERWASVWAAAGTVVVAGAPVGAVSWNTDDMMSERSWGMFHGVKASQYANDVMLHDLDQRYGSAGLRLVAWNPGPTRGTRVARHLPAWARALFTVVNLGGRSLARVGEQGAELVRRPPPFSLTWVSGKRTVRSPAKPDWPAAARTLRELDRRLLER